MSVFDTILPFGDGVATSFPSFTGDDLQRSAKLHKAGASFFSSASIFSEDLHHRTIDDWSSTGAETAPKVVGRQECESPTTDNDSGGRGCGARSDRYKTELCRQFGETGACRYGDKCQFAHGLGQLRTVSRHPKYKTNPCRTFHSTGFCPYGARCHFVHGEGATTTARVDSGARTMGVVGCASSASSRQHWGASGRVDATVEDSSSIHHHDSAEVDRLIRGIHALLNRSAVESFPVNRQHQSTILPPPPQQQQQQLYHQHQHSDVRSVSSEGSVGGFSARLYGAQPPMGSTSVSPALSSCPESPTQHSPASRHPFEYGDVFPAPSLPFEGDVWTSIANMIRVGV